MLNYNYRQASYLIKPESGATITAYSEVHWTSETHEKKLFKVFLAVEGFLRERSEAWTERWVFPWPDENLKKLEDGLTLINNYLGARELHVEKRREVFVDVYDWLCVGWVDEGEKKSKGYLRFSKDGKVMKAEFAEAAHLYAFRTALLRVLSP